MLNNTERRILNIIRENKSISRIEIVERLKLSKPVVSVHIKKLIELGFVRENKENHTSKKFGRRRIGLSFVPDCMYVIGIDIGGTKLEGIIGDLDGNIVRSLKYSTRGITTQKELEGLLTKTVAKLKDKFLKNIIGIGIGVPGTVEPDLGVVKYMPAFGLRNVNLKVFLEDKFGLPVYIENDVTLDAYAESRIGTGRDYKNIFLVSIGTGIGSGIIIEKKIYRGSRGTAGEIGNIITDWSIDKKFFPLSFGPLEEWFSGASLEKKFSVLGIQDIKKGFELMEERKDVASIIKKGIEHIGVALSDIIYLLNPEVVIVKGGIGYNQYDRIMAYMLPVIKKIVFPEILEGVRFERGKIKEFGVAIGALFFVQKSILKI